MGGTLEGLSVRVRTGRHGFGRVLGALALLATAAIAILAPAASASAGGAMAESIAIDPSGKLVVAGTLWNGRADPFTLFGITLARYKPDGSLDPSFGRNGRVTTVAGENP